MKINCHAFLTCDHPGCTAQFLITQAWEMSPSQVADEAEKAGWERRMWLKLEPRMFCPAHSKKALAIVSN